MEKLRFVSSYAYGEDDDPVNLEEGDGLSCPVCGRPIGWKKWLQPKLVKLEKPKYGTFIYGTFDTFLVSEVFKEKYEASGMVGIKHFDEVTITKVGRMRESSPKPPRYYHVEIKMAETEVDEELRLPLQFIQDELNPKNYQLYDPNTGQISKASKEECIGLERAAVWEAEHVEDRLRDFYSGVQNKWVEQLKIK